MSTTSITFRETPLVALAALKLGRPVKWVEDRRENFLSAPQGRGVRGVCIDLHQGPLQHVAGELDLTPR